MSDERAQQNEQFDAQTQTGNKEAENPLYDIAHENDDETCADMHVDSISPSSAQNT